MLTPSSDKILEETRNILKVEGILTEAKSKEPMAILETLILPGLENSKDILAAIYYKSRNRLGFVGKLKTAVQSKLINTVINVIEKQSMKQQKFNGLVHKAVEQLVEENKRLREEIVELKNKMGLQ